MNLNDIIKVNGDIIEICGRAYERVVHCLDCPFYDIAKDYCNIHKTYKAKDDYCSTPKRARQKGDK